MMTKLVESYEPDDNIFAVKPKASGGMRLTTRDVKVGSARE